MVLGKNQQCMDKLMALYDVKENDCSLFQQIDTTTEERAKFTILQLLALPMAITQLVLTLITPIHLFDLQKTCN